MDMELLLKDLPWQILVCHVRIPVFIPRFAPIPGHVVGEIIDEARIHGTARSYFPFRIGHAGDMAGIDGRCY